MANYQTILFLKDGPVALVTINRPDKLNALNSTVLAELKQAFAEITADADLKAVVLTGAGEKAFVAGADIAEMVNYGPAEGLAFITHGQSTLDAIDNCTKIVIAAVNGFALGGGMELAMACDFIYASSKARFGLPEINLAIIPGFGGTQRLSRLVGKAAAKEIILTGDMIGADEALRIGLANKVFAPEELMNEAKKTAAKIASKGGVALRFAKECINNGSNTDLDRGQVFERQSFSILCSTEDKKEGMTAFLEKRAPVLKNR